MPPKKLKVDIEEAMVSMSSLALIFYEAYLRAKVGAVADEALLNEMLDRMLEIDRLVLSPETYSKVFRKLTLLEGLGAKPMLQ